MRVLKVRSTQITFKFDKENKPIGNPFFLEFCLITKVQQTIVKIAESPEYIRDLLQSATLFLHNIILKIELEVITKS
jgi:hypothetical protein